MRVRYTSQDMKNPATKPKPAAKRTHKPAARLHRALKDHLVPHPGNDHLPHLLKHKALFSYSALLIGLKLATVGIALALPAHSLLSSAVTPGNIVQLTNETRETLGLPGLSTDSKLMAAAQAKAEDMFTNEYFAHTSPAGTTPWYWFQEYGYDYRSAGENLAAHFSSAEDVEAGWMASPTHRDNIVSDRYDEIGVGVAQGVYNGYHTTFVVQLFGYEIGDNHDLISDIATTDLINPDSLAETQGSADALPVIHSNFPGAAPTEALAAPTVTQDAPAEAQVGKFTINDYDASVEPIQNGYNIRVNLQQAAWATAKLSDQTVTLKNVPGTSEWTGNITYNPATLSPNGDQIVLIASNLQGEQVVKNIAWVLRGQDSVELYAFQQAEAPKLLGVMDVTNVRDDVQAIYIFTLIFLGALLLSALVIKLEAHRPSIVVHGLAVMALALFLVIF